MKRPAKKAVKKTAKKAVRKAVKKSAKRGSVSAKIVIPPVPTRAAAKTIVSTTPKATTSTTPKTAAAAPAKKSSSRVTLLVLLGILILGLIVSNRNNSADDAAPTPTESATVSESPTPEASPTPDALAAHEAPLSFVAINNGSGGVTLRWKTPAAAEGITGYNISVSYNAKDFTLVSTVPANQLNLDIAKAGDEGGTQFLIQTVYSDGQTVDGKKFSLKGKYA